MSDMHTAYKVAAIAVRQRLAEQHPTALKRIDNIRSGDVAVYSGSFDRVEDVLKCLNVPVTMNPNADKLKARIIFANYSSSYDNKLIAQLREQVENGKWLVSSDWALGLLIAQAFPNMVQRAQGATGDEVISVEPSLNSLWSEVVVLGAEP